MIDEHTAPSGSPGGALGRFLDRLQNVSREGRGFKASCPAPGHGQGRGDQDPSLSIGQGDDGRVLLKCHVGCTKAEILDAMGLSPSDLFEKSVGNGHKRNGHRSPKKKRRGKIVETYDYTNEAGDELLFQGLRYEPKDFSQRKPDGAGGWVYQDVFKNGTRPVLYRLPKVMEAVREGRPVWVVEGEKDVHRMEREGFTATTSPMGAEKWRDHLSDALVGANVRILPDNDDPGRRHALKVARGLRGKAASVKIVELPGVSEDGGDVSDWLAAGGTAEELEELAAQGSEWAPPEPETTSKSGRRNKPNLTDVGNAERLVERHGADIRFCYPLGQWLCFDGQRWRGDDAGEVERRSKETVRATLREAAPEEGPVIDRDLARHALASESRARIEAMIALARSEPGIPIGPEEMDPDQWLLNVENGTIDLRTGELREHRRQDLITKLAPVEYDPSAEAPTWEACLETWLPSEGLRRFVQKAVGYALTGDVSEQVLLFLYGTGANGKSTLINAIMEAMGDYALQAAPELLTIKASAHPTELADLKGARFVASVEVEDGKHLAESLVKQMTGGDRIKARFMRADFFEFSPTHKVFLAANHKPEVRGTDTGIWRRIKTVPFDVTIPKEGRDPALPAKLRDELPGILRWAVEGCLSWQREGLGEPEEVKAATAEYRQEMDVLAGFIEERCVTRPGAWAKFADLYAEYEKWCHESGELAEKKRTFGTRLKERGFPPAKGTDNVSIRTGIALRSDREPPDSPPDNGDQGPEKDPENYPSTVNYPDSGFSDQNDSRIGLTPKQGTDGYLGNSGDPLEDLFSDPPDWLATQLDKCREEERFVKPTCATAAGEVFGTVTRWAEVEPVLRRRLAEGGRS